MPQDASLAFFENPIVNPPCTHPGRHRGLDADGQPTNRLIESRRPSDLIAPVREAKKHKAPKGPTAQVELAPTAEDECPSTAEQKYGTPHVPESPPPRLGACRRQDPCYYERL